MGSKWGITSTGFVRPRLADIKAELESQLAEAFGRPINTRADSVMGQLIGVFAAREADWWEELENTYYAMYPHTANGSHQDNSVAFTGVRRISAEKTSLVATCYGVNGTIIMDGSRIRSAVDQSQTFSSSGIATISTSTASYAEISILTLASGATYTLTIDGTTYSYTATASDTVASVLVSIAAKLSAIGGTVDVSNGKMKLERADQRTGWTISASTNMQIGTVGSPVSFVADAYGAISPAVGTVTQIVTQISGWERVSNLVAAAVGREMETDTELRLRYGRSVYRQGQALIEAMQARLYEDVIGVTAAIVFENPTDAVDASGRPPHSLECVVQGGDDSAIAQMIWQTKPPGIDLVGTTAVEITDSQGSRHTMKFNRPTVKKIWLKCSLTKNPDESFAGDTPTRVRDILLATGQKQKIGQDVVLQRYFGPVYTGTIGIGGITLTAAVGDTAPDAGAYSAANIVIGSSELASFEAGRIEVIVL